MAISMKVKDIMAGKAPSASFTGFSTADDYIFAIDTASGGTSNIEDYIVGQLGVKGFERSLNPETQTDTYLRAGSSTVKTGTQSTFSITSDRYVGDPFQDFCLSAKIKYGTGQSVIVPYVYFNLLTGAGEVGKVSIMVENDGSGDAGSKAEVSINFEKVGDAPKIFDWETDKAKDYDTIESVTYNLLSIDEKESKQK